MQNETNGIERKNGAILQVHDLSVAIFCSSRNLRTADSRPPDGAFAVKKVNLCLGQGRALGIVGESGCGKSLTARSLLGLIPRSARARVSGRALLQARPGEPAVDLLGLSESQLRQIRGRRVAMIYQDPMTALSPFFTVGFQMRETLRAHQSLSRHACDNKAIELLGEVGIRHPERQIKLFPHQFSGGMRQRVIIAMALAHQPQLLIADEPTTGLDAVIQVQILDLLRHLLDRSQNMGVLFISHDLSAVRHLCDEVAVMYAGEIVEADTKSRVLGAPQHPYTQSLINCLPRWEPRDTYTLRPLDGFPPRPVKLSPEGPKALCAFRPRCTLAKEICGRKPAPWTTLDHLSSAQTGPTLVPHGVQCHLPNPHPSQHGASL